jgi:hypothetical protein
MKDKYSSPDFEYYQDVKNAELEEVEWSIVWETNNYYVKPTMAIHLHGEPYVTYGVFSKHTGVMEADSRQFPAAKGWSMALDRLVERASNEDDFGEIVNIMEDAPGTLQ